MTWTITRRALRPISIRVGAIRADAIGTRLARARLIAVSSEPTEAFAPEDWPGGELAGAELGQRTHDVLIVEDDPDSREALADILGEEGYSVLTASNGRDALEMLQSAIDRNAPEALPGVILLDLMMPVMDGWEFLRRRSADARLARIPVFILSGAADFGGDRAGQERTTLDAALRFTKPIDLSALLTAIHRLRG